MKSRRYDFGLSVQASVLGVVLPELREKGGLGGIYGSVESRG
jgi:hypothetical protein